MKIKRLLFLGLFVMFLFVFALTSNSYAAENTDTIETITIKVFNKPECNLKINKAIYDNYKYVLIFTSIGNYNNILCHVILSNSEFYYNSLNGCVYFTGQSYYHIFYFSSSKNFVDASDFVATDSTYRDNAVNGSPHERFVGGLAEYGAFHSKADIYSYDESNGKGDLVFQAAPQKVGLVVMMKSVNFSEVLQELMTILPIVLVMVIGILCLKKAIELLFKMLQKV